MENEETWNENFNWFDEEHYECFEMEAGSREAILTAFHELTLKKFPNKKFGTTLKNIRQENKLWKATIKRFKTEALCKKHCLMPPSYIRTGEMVP